jgi:N-acyl homoserine lactone hydrolase
MIELQGQPVRLAVLDYGLFKVHSNGRVIGISGFLIETGAGERVLIDTGLPLKYSRDPVAASQEDQLGSFGEVKSIGPENTPAQQLALLGLAPDDIDLLVISHTHIDHIGDMAGFGKSPILIAQAERDLPRPLYWGNAQPMEWPQRAYLTITGDIDVGPGFHIFLVPGHAPGQMAFLLELPRTGPILLTSDSISRPDEIAEGFAGSWNEEQAQANAERLMQIAQDRDAFVIYGHCPTQWRELRKAPYRYE